jgi:hypothetical protein
MIISEFSQWGSSITGLWSDKLKKKEYSHYITLENIQPYLPKGFTAWI